MLHVNTSIGRIADLSTPEVRQASVNVPLTQSGLAIYLF